MIYERSSFDKLYVWHIIESYNYKCYGPGWCKLQVAGHCFTIADKPQALTNANTQPKK